MRWTGKVKPGVSDFLVSQIDFFASFADLCGVDIPEGAAPDSENHLKSLLNKNRSGRKYLVEQNIQNNLSITCGDWKYIPKAKGPAKNWQTNTELGNNPKTGQLYNLKDDPYEKNNLYDSNQERAGELHRELLKIVESGVYYRTLEK